MRAPYGQVATWYCLLLLVELSWLIVMLDKSFRMWQLPLGKFCVEAPDP